MRKLMRLDEAIEKGIVKNLDKVDPNALFPKKSNKVTLEPIITGVDKEQEIYREDFDYIFFKSRVKREMNFSMLALGKNENRKSLIELKGRTGYLWRHTSWGRINELYSNSDNGIRANTLSEEELNFLFERNKRFKGFKFATWIDQSFKEIVQGDDMKSITKYGLKFAKERTIFRQALWFSSRDVGKGTFDYCPFINIWGPYEIMVVMNSKKKDGKWKLIPRKGLLKWWYRLF